MIIKSSFTFDHKQTTPSQTWVIVHNLNRLPNCDVRIVVDGLLCKIIPSSISYTDLNTAEIVFTDVQVGTARLV